MHIWAVLGLARTGLIFTGLQEGAQPGGLTPPGQTEQGIPYHVPSRWVSVGGSRQQELSRGSGGHSGGAVQESGSVLLVCFVYSPFSVSLLFLFPLSAVLLNCPYPDPPVSASFFPFSSAPRRGEGRPHGAFVAGSSQKQEHGHIMLSYLYFHFKSASARCICNNTVLTDPTKLSSMFPILKSIPFGTYT